MNNSRPNILFFFTDDQRFDTNRALGNEQIRTPNLDRLVPPERCLRTLISPEGALELCVCRVARCCIPVRALFHIEREGQEIPEEHTTMGECFQQECYQTFGTGKWHNGRGAYARSFQTGDEIFFGGMNDHWNVPAYHYDPEGKYDIKSPFVRDWYYKNNLEYNHCDHMTPGKHSTDLFTDVSLDFLKTKDAEKPFLCMCR